MSNALVGYTGFVGSNLMDSFQFDHYYNSSNINDAYNLNPDLLIYSGIRAEKYLANKNPEFDFAMINEAIENIKRIHPKKLVLISTVDVYQNPDQVDEDSKMIPEGLQAYGYNRYHLEQWVQNELQDSHIVRLPGLYGKRLKKNFIFDYINIIPSLLTVSKYTELFYTDHRISEYYYDLGNGYYKCIDLSTEQKKDLKNYYNQIGFSAVYFTDSRGRYQYYNLAYLWEHLQVAMKNGIKLLNLATEPVVISELYYYLKNEVFINEILQNVPNYDFRTKYDRLFGKDYGYIVNKNEVLSSIKNFVEEQRI